MRLVFVMSLVGLWCGAVPCRGEERKVLAPEQVERDRPPGEVTVAFRVAEVGRLLTLALEGDPDPEPVLLWAAADLKDRRNRLYCVPGG